MFVVDGDPNVVALVDVLGLGRSLDIGEQSLLDSLLERSATRPAFEFTRPFELDYDIVVAEVSMVTLDMQYYV